MFPNLKETPVPISAARMLWKIMRRHLTTQPQLQRRVAPIDRPIAPEMVGRNVWFTVADDDRLRGPFVISLFDELNRTVYFREPLPPEITKDSMMIFEGDSE